MNAGGTRLGESGSQRDREWHWRRTAVTATIILGLVACATGGAKNETDATAGMESGGSEGVAGTAGRAGDVAGRAGQESGAAAAIGGRESSVVGGSAQGGATAGEQGGATGGTEAGGQAGSASKWSCHVVSEAGSLCRCSTPFDLIGSATPLVGVCPETPCCVTQTTASYSTCTCWDIPAGQCASTYKAPEWTLVASCPPPADGGTVVVPACKTVDPQPSPGENCAVYPNLCASNGDCVLPPHQYVCGSNSQPPMAGCVPTTSAKGEPYYCCSELRCVRYSSADATCKQLGKAQGYSCPPDMAGLPAGCSAVGNNLYCCP